MNANVVVGIGNIYANESLFKGASIRARARAASPADDASDWSRREGRSSRRDAAGGSEACATSCNPTAPRGIFSSTTASTTAPRSRAGFAGPRSGVADGAALKLLLRDRQKRK